MTFTNAEVRFLSQGGQRRGNGWAPLKAIDFETCPPHILQRILEHRARVLGPEFEAFQEEQRRLGNPSAPFIPLEQEVASSKLF